MAIHVLRPLRRDRHDDPRHLEIQADVEVQVFERAFDWQSPVDAEGGRRTTIHIHSSLTLSLCTARPSAFSCLHWHDAHEFVCGTFQFSFRTMMVVSDVSCVTLEDRTKVHISPHIHFTILAQAQADRETFAQRRNLNQKTVDVLRISMFIMNKSLHLAARCGPGADRSISQGKDVTRLR